MEAFLLLRPKTIIAAPVPAALVIHVLFFLAGVLKNKTFVISDARSQM